MKLIRFIGFFWICCLFSCYEYREKIVIEKSIPLYPMQSNQECCQDRLDLSHSQDLQLHIEAYVENSGYNGEVLIDNPAVWVSGDLSTIVNQVDFDRQTYSFSTLSQNIHYDCKHRSSNAFTYVYQDSLDSEKEQFLDQKFHPKPVVENFNPRAYVEDNEYEKNKLEQQKQEVLATINHYYQFEFKEFPCSILLDHRSMDIEVEIIIQTPYREELDGMTLTQILEDSKTQYQVQIFQRVLMSLFDVEEHEQKILIASTKPIDQELEFVR
ncbi:MAG: hypothetical protein R3A11_08830 [Bdellovibrionota bacterium]